MLQEVYQGFPTLLPCLLRGDTPGHRFPRRLACKCCPKKYERQKRKPKIIMLATLVANKGRDNGITKVERKGDPSRSSLGFRWVGWG